MIVLAIDTATDRAGVALITPWGPRARAVTWRATFTETAPAVNRLLDEAGVGWPAVGGLAVPAGPGSFTGLRVGAAFAMAVAEARRIALHAVPTLVAIAEAFAAGTDDRVCASLDARRGRRYAALLERDSGGVWRVVAGPHDLDPAAVEALADDAPIVGIDRPARGESRSPAPVASALAELVARDPRRYRLPAPDRLEILYARPGTDAPARGR